MKCQSCGQTVVKRGNFCPNCGARIVPRRSTPKKSKPTRSMPMSYAAAFIAVGALVGFMIFKLSTAPDSSQMVVEGNGVQSLGFIPTELRAQVQDIASEFMCPCGGCTDALDVCTCDMKNGAVEIKTFIAQQLQAGHKKPHIVEMVNDRYGGLKDAAAPTVDFNKLDFKKF
jgi:cytochrome c-type biogenesis protein CcmH/NrfF